MKWPRKCAKSAKGLVFMRLLAPKAFGVDSLFAAILFSLSLVYATDYSVRRRDRGSRQPLHELALGRRRAQIRFWQGRLAEATSDGSASRPYLRWRLLFQDLICATRRIQLRSTLENGAAEI